MNATMTVMPRNSGWCQSQRTPSPTSARMPLGVAPSGWSGRNGLRIRVSATALTAKLTASSTNGTACPSRNRNPPSGGPTNSLPVSSAADSRALPLGRWSLPTILGSIVGAATSNSTSQTPSTSTSAYSTMIWTEPASTVAASTAAMTVRTTWTLIMSTRRSVRSTRAPANRLTSSQGRSAATVRPAMAIGSRVIAAASSGNAVSRTPSPRFATAEDAQSRR